MHLSTSQKLALRASLFSTILSPCHAYVNWLYPQSSARNLVYNYNDLVYFTWDSNFTEPSITLWCASDNSYYTLYTANVTTNGTSPQNFPYADAFNQSCHMSLYCHGSPDCGPVGQSAEFSLSHNKAAAAQTWGLAATASIGKAAPTATAITTTTSSASSSSSVAAAAAKTATGAAAPTASSGGLSTSEKAGMGVGVAVGVIVVGAVVWFCAMGARRRRREGQMGAGSGGFWASKGMSERRYAGGSGWMGPPRQEMDGEGRMNELQGTPQAELSSVMSPVR